MTSPGSSAVFRRLATVTDVTNGLVTVAIGDDTDNVTEDIPILASVGALVVDDVVLVDLYANSAVVVDRVNGGTPVPIRVWSASTPTGTTTSATNVTLSTPGTFYKWNPNSVVKVDMRASFFATGATNTEATFAVGFNGADTDIMAIYANPIAQHFAGSGVRYITGLPNGSLTVTFRWRRSTGTGTCNRDGNDYLNLSIEEVM